MLESASIRRRVLWLHHYYWLLVHSPLILLVYAITRASNTLLFSLVKRDRPPQVYPVSRQLYLGAIRQTQYAIVTIFTV